MRRSMGSRFRWPFIITIVGAIFVILIGLVSSWPNNTLIHGSFELASHGGTQTPIDNDLTYFNFGQVIVNPEGLSHTFWLSNKSTKPLKILSATPLSPCCSFINKYDTIIPPREKGRIQVSLRPGMEHGRRRVHFLVQTDSVVLRSITFTLEADLVPGFEIDDYGSLLLQCFENETSPSSLSITCRQKDGRGAAIPEAFHGADDLIVELSGPWKESTTRDGMHVFHNALNVKLPPKSKPGVYTTFIEILFSDGTQGRYALRWEVVPALVISPTAIIVNSAKTTHIVIKSRDNSPFRILNIDSPNAQAFQFDDERRAALHHLTFTYSPHNPEPPSQEVSIATDHPKQRSIVLSIIRPPHGEAGP